MASHKVAVLAYEGMSAFGVGSVVETLGIRPEGHVGDWYDVRIAAGGPVRLVDGTIMTPAADLDDLASAGTVIVPGVPDVEGDPAPAVLSALRRAHVGGARMVSACIGAFALAAAGLLDGRRVTTHWQHADLLRARFPAVSVEPDVLYVDEGDVLTGAGHAAALDLCLHLIRRDFGAAVANTVARRLVVTPHRNGGQAQFIEVPVAEDRGGDGVAQSMEWAREHLTAPLTVGALAARAAMSERTYLRRFRASTGLSPMKWLIVQRVQASLPLLETTDLPIERVSAAVGFERPVTYRHHFARAMRTSPSAYRAAFRTG